MWLAATADNPLYTTRHSSIENVRSSSAPDDWRDQRRAPLDASLGSSPLTVLKLKSSLGGVSSSLRLVPSALPEHLLVNLTPPCSPPAESLLLAIVLRSFDEQAVVGAASTWSHHISITYSIYIFHLTKATEPPLARTSSIIEANNLSIQHKLVERHFPFFCFLFGPREIAHLSSKHQYL